MQKLVDGAPAVHLGAIGGPAVGQYPMDLVMEIRMGMGMRDMRDMGDMGIGKGTSGLRIRALVEWKHLSNRMLTLSPIDHTRSPSSGSEAVKDKGCGARPQSPRSTGERAVLLQ